MSAWPAAASRCRADRSYEGNGGEVSHIHHGRCMSQLSRVITVVTLIVDLAETAAGKEDRMGLKTR